MLSIALQRDGGVRQTLVEQLVDAIRLAIDERRVKEGAEFPSVRKFAQEQGVSTFTVAEAYARLSAQGYLVAIPGSCYTVRRSTQPGEAARLSAPGSAPPALGASWLLADVFADHAVPIKAGCGWLPSDWLNASGLHQALREVGRMPPGQLSAYGHPYGLAALRERIGQGLREYGVPAGPGQVVITHGVTQGLDLVVRTLLSPGDCVVVEQPCYCNLLQVLQLAGVRAVGVARSAAGLDPAELEAVVRQHKPKAIFVNTALHNPTGTTLPAACAFRLLQIAERYDLLVIEDDIYRDLAPAGSTLLAAMDGLERVIHLGGFSKTIAPSLRIGYVAARASIAQRLARTKMAVGLTSSEINERLVCAVLAGGHYARHVARLTTDLTRQRRKVGEQLAAAGFTLGHQPDGGMFLWARLPPALAEGGAKRIAAMALARGIWLAPGAYFHCDEADIPWLRFNVATSDDPALWAFFDELTAASLS